MSFMYFWALSAKLTAQRQWGNDTNWIVRKMIVGIKIKKKLRITKNKHTENLSRHYIKRLWLFFLVEFSGKFVTKHPIRQ
jgi:hypothetical protein